MDGDAGWLRSALDETDQQTIYLDLSQTSDAQSLNPETNRVGLALAHLPWELLHDGKAFLLQKAILPVRKVRQRTGEIVGALNRPLRLLFMATSPEDITLLDYEKEETNILEATEDHPLALVVEESGSIEQLEVLVKNYKDNKFDIFHLTGHGLIYTKAEYGYLNPSNRQIEKKCPDWHLLRIYRDSRAIAKLVTPPFTDDREELKPLQAENDFLDANNQIKVASRFEFIGRRRQLQRCLQALKKNSGYFGVFIHGMGGLGKSTLTARLCTRVRAQRDKYQQVVLVGDLDEVRLLRELINKYERFPGIPAMLNQPEMSLKGRLQNFFATIESTRIDQPVLLVLDDFEQNISQGNINENSLRMSAEAYRVFEAICAALQQNQAVSRLIVTCRYLCPLPKNSLFQEALAGMNASDIDKKGRLLPDETRKSREYPRIVQIADGNPRLLEWLATVLLQPNLDKAEILTQLEQTEQRFREDILAETLLNTLTQEEQKFLACLSVFKLSVPVEIISAVTPDLSWLNKAVNLSLVEQVIVGGTQKEYRVTTILEPLLKNVLSDAEWQNTRQQAAQRTYQVWWQEAKTSTKEQKLEIVSLGLLAEEQEIAVTVGDTVATNWVNNLRFREALELCNEILAVFEDYRILGTVARAEVALGKNQEAEVNYQKALRLCPSQDVAKQAITLHNWAKLIAQQGNLSEAMELYQQSLSLKQTINNVKGQAATLHQMAYLAGTTGDHARQLELYLQAAQLLVQVKAYVDLMTVLSNLAVCDESNNLVYLAQATWLCLKIPAPLAKVIDVMFALYNLVPKADELKALLATTAVYFCQTRGEGHLNVEDLQELSGKMLIAAADAQGIETQEAFDAWIIQQQLNTSEFFLPRLSQCLQEMVGDGWLFEPDGLE